MADVITVKIGRVPGAITEVAINGGQPRTVETVLELAGLESEGYEVRKNSVTVTDLSTAVNQGDVILLLTKIKGAADVITVKVGRVPGAITEVAINGGQPRTVETALDLAGLDSEGYEIRKNSATVTDLTTAVGNGDVILLLTKIKGAMPAIKVGRVPGVIQELNVEAGTTVEAALSAAGLSSEGYEVRRNGESLTDLGVSTNEGDTILLLSKIKGAL